MSDPSPALQARLKVQQNVREQFIAVEEVKLLQDAVAECYRKEGAPPSGAERADAALQA